MEQDKIKKVKRASDIQQKRSSQQVTIEVGDTLILKKIHPCGSNEWEVLRMGADCRLKCSGCGHQLMMPRVKLTAAVRIVKKAELNE